MSEVREDTLHNTVEENSSKEPALAQEENNLNSAEKQEARAFLRERFLRAMNGMIGKQATFSLYENTKVTAEFRGCDIDFTEVYVRNLMTPMGKVPEAILRVTDIISVEFESMNIEYK